MPRGVPKAAKPVKNATDSAGNPLAFKFSSFPAPIGALNAKNVSGAFAKQDSQSWWTRRPNDAEWQSERQEKRRRLMEPEEKAAANGESADNEMNGDASSAQAESKEEAALPTAEENSFRTIVIHPGSRWLRIGKASDPLPVAIQHVIARKQKTPRDPKKPTAYEGPAVIDPSLDPKIEAIRTGFKSRMRDYKLRQAPNGQLQAQAYNETVDPDIIPELNDPFKIDWTEPAEMDHPEGLIGQDALRLADPEKAGYSLRWPFSRGNFHTHGYSAAEELLGDVQLLWTLALEKELEIPASEHHLYSVMLIVPDLADDNFLREMTHLLLCTMGFKKLCIQQESLAVIFGVGVSSACIVDIGATKTSIACVEEGAILADSRIALAYGGDDITEFLVQLLLRANFPYKDLNLNRAYEWDIINTLKEKICVLSEADVGLNLYNFDVRRPGKPTHKYSMRLFDEIILAPYCLFSPRTVDFDRKALAGPQLWAPQGTIDGVVDTGKHRPTAAMKASVARAEPLQRAGTPSLSVAAEGPSRVSSPAPSAAGADESMSRANSPKPATLAPPTDKPAPVKETRSDEELFFESSKVPLDLAVLESLAASGTEDRAKRLAQNIFIVGGTGRMINCAWGLQSRLLGLMAARYPTQPPPSVLIQPPTRELDHRILAWKGVSTLGRLEVSNDMWIRRDDFDLYGLKAVRDRSTL